MTYSAVVLDKLDSAALADWQVVHGHVGDSFSDPDYLSLIQRHLGESAPCRFVIFYNENDQPVGITTISACSLDVTQLAPQLARHAVSWIRRVWPSYLQLKTVMCGPPTMVLQQKLYLLAGVDRCKLLHALDDLLCKFAKEEKAHVVLMGDFDATDRPWLDSLMECGYLVGDSHPANLLELPFATFDEYVGCMRSDPARKVRHNRKQLTKVDATVKHYWGGAEAAAAFTDEHYEFYLQLLERVDLSMTTLPIDFFRSLLETFPDSVNFVDIRIAGKPAAFGIGLNIQGERYEALFVGYDQQLNRKYFLYFNVFFEVISAAMSAGCSSAELGATSDTFKARVGAAPRGRTMYVKAFGLFRFLLQRFQSLMLPPHPVPSPRNIFSQEVRNTQKQKV